MNANDNNTITVTLTFPVVRDGDKFAMPGWMPRTRDEWVRMGATWGDSAGRDVARAMVKYIDSLPESQPPSGYGFLGTLDVDGVVYDVSRTERGFIYANSRSDGKYFTFPTGRVATSDWSDILAAGTFTPRSDA